LRESVLRKERKVQADPVGGPMNRGDEQEGHEEPEPLGRAPARRV
jgi:hypothetical protein